MSASLPGSCPANWLQGKPSTAKPRGPYSACSAWSASYCGVSPHFDATFTTSSALPR